MDAKTTEQEVNTIMKRFAPEWDTLSLREKKAVWTECMKEQNVVWESFSLGQKNWVIRQLGFWKFLKANSDGSGGNFVAGVLVYWLRVHPKGCLMTFGILAVVAVIASKVAGLW